MNIFPSYLKITLIIQMIDLFGHSFSHFPICDDSFEIFTKNEKVNTFINGQVVVFGKKLLMNLYQFPSGRLEETGN